MMRFSRRVTALAGALLLAACGNGPTDTVPDQQLDQRESEITADPGTPPAAAKPERRSPHAFRRGGGPEMLLRAALGEIDLRADQKEKIDSLASELRAARPEKDGALEKALAAGVRAGSFDESLLQKQYSEIETRAKEHAAKLSSVLNQLHQTLDAGQRSALVAALEKRMKDGPRRGAERRNAGVIQKVSNQAARAQCEAWATCTRSARWVSVTNSDKSWRVFEVTGPISRDRGASSPLARRKC
jgi:Spy/CpxP family protein refolding chaperone